MDSGEQPISAAISRSLRPSLSSGATLARSKISRGTATNAALLTSLGETGLHALADTNARLFGDRAQGCRATPVRVARDTQGVSQNGDFRVENHGRRNSPT